MYYWNERYENIWDSAPRPRRGGRAPGQRSIQCACKDKDLQDQLDKLLKAFCRITPETVSGVAVRYLKQDLCCCNKNYCKHTDQDIPESELDSDVWELYTYFLNEFNNEEPNKMDVESSQDVTDSKLDSVVEANSAEPEPYDLFGDDEDKENSDHQLPQKDPYFKVKIMNTMKECMKYRDIHRFYLLQHIKILLHYFHFVQGMEKDIVLPPGD